MRAISEPLLHHRNSSALRPFRTIVVIWIERRASLWHSPPSPKDRSTLRPFGTAIGAKSKSMEFSTNNCPCNSSKPSSFSRQSKRYSAHRTPNSNSATKQQQCMRRLQTAISAVRSTALTTESVEICTAGLKDRCLEMSFHVCFEWNVLKIVGQCRPLAKN